jgi:hypothetical protein
MLGLFEASREGMSLQPFRGCFLKLASVGPWFA